MLNEKITSHTNMRFIIITILLLLNNRTNKLDIEKGHRVKKYALKIGG